jgi:hypothetical protein
MPSPTGGSLVTPPWRPLPSPDVSLRRRGHQRFKLLDEKHSLRRGDIPDNIKLHIFVPVDDRVPRADDLSPGDFGVVLPKLESEAASGFSNEGRRMENGKLKKLIAVEVLTRPTFEETCQSATSQDNVEDRRGITIHRSPGLY